jgi:hypothetical protein
MSGLLRSFRDANVRLSRRLLPASLWQTRGFAVYDLMARALLGEEHVRTVVDVGGGRTWHFGDSYRDRPRLPSHRRRRERRRARAQSARRRGRGCRRLQGNTAGGSYCGPAAVPRGGRASARHRRLPANAHRLLKPGGRAVIVFANKWAPPTISTR